MFFFIDIWSPRFVFYVLAFVVGVILLGLSAANHNDPIYAQSCPFASSSGDSSLITLCATPPVGITAGVLAMVFGILGMVWMLVSTLWDLTFFKFIIAIRYVKAQM